MGGSEGLGYLITYSQPLFLTARVFAAIFLLSVMGIILFVLGVWIEHLTMPWHFNAKRSRAMEIP